MTRQAGAPGSPAASPACSCRFIPESSSSSSSAGLANGLSSVGRRSCGSWSSEIWPGSSDPGKSSPDGPEDPSESSSASSESVLPVAGEPSDGSCCELVGGDVRSPLFGGGKGIALRKEDTSLREKLDAALKEILADGTYKTINGAELTVKGDAPSFEVGDSGAKVVCSGIQTANATVYLIDTVLMPPAS